MDSEVGFDMLSNIIKAQNKALIKQIAKDFIRDESRLMKRYLKPEYYLPVVIKTLCDDVGRDNDDG
jgi:hypothetical protein